VYEMCTLGLDLFYIGNRALAVAPVEVPQAIAGTLRTCPNPPMDWARISNLP